MLAAAARRIFSKHLGHLAAGALTARLAADVDAVQHLSERAAENWRASKPYFSARTNPEHPEFGRLLNEGNSIAHEYDNLSRTFDALSEFESQTWRGAHVAPSVARFMAGAPSKAAMHGFEHRGDVKSSKFRAEAAKGFAMDVFGRSVPVGNMPKASISRAAAENFGEIFSMLHAAKDEHAGDAHSVIEARRAASPALFEAYRRSVERLSDPSFEIPQGVQAL